MRADGDPTNAKPFIAKIQAFKPDPDNGGLEVTVRWYYRPEDAGVGGCSPCAWHGSSAAPSAPCGIQHTNPQTALRCAACRHSWRAQGLPWRGEQPEAAASPRGLPSSAASCSGGVATRTFFMRPPLPCHCHCLASALPLACLPYPALPLPLHGICPPTLCPPPSAPACSASCI